MAFKMKATSGSGGGTEKAPAGNHMAVLVGVFEMGTQEETFQGETSARRKVALVWELVNEQIAGAAKNHTVIAAVTQSLNEKATLRKWIEARLGRKLGADEDFDISTELGQGCMLNVIANDKGYPRVEGVAAIPKGIPVPKPTYPPTAVTLEEFEGGKQIPEWVPWLYGSELAAHVAACQEIGAPKPVRKGQSQPAEQPADKGPIPF